MDVFADDPEPYRPTFRPFTRQELQRIETRICEKRRLERKRSRRTRAKKEGRRKSQEHYNNDDDETDDEEDDDRPKEPNPKLAQGSDLPRRIFRDFPPELSGAPLCDLDPFYEDELTFVVISNEGSIFRFSAKDSLFLLSPFHSVRRVALAVLTHRLFSFMVILTILANCYLMVKADTEYTASAELLFTVLYTNEAAIKILSRGFVLSPFTYLRDPWNCLDTLVIGTSYVDLAVDLASFSSVRAFRVVRALKSVAVVPGLKTIVGAIIRSVRNLRDVVFLTLFMLSVFALLGLQLYMGVLSQICIRDFDNSLQEYPNSSFSWETWVRNRSNWLTSDGSNKLILCGNASGAGVCPEGATCLQGIGPNPDYGYTSFDNFWSAYLCAFRLMTQDYWESLYQMTLRTAGPWNMVFFVANIFLGSFYLLNLILAIVAMSYDELQRQKEKERARELEDLEALRAKEDETIQDAEQVIRAALVKTGLDNLGFLGENDGQNESLSKVREEIEGPNYKAIFLTNLQKIVGVFCVWDCGSFWIKFSELLARFVFDPFTELLITFCIIVNVLFLAMEHYDIDYAGGMSPTFLSLLRNGNYFFTTIFAIESIVKLAAMSPRYFFMESWNCFDFLIFVLSLVELLSEDVSGLSMLRSFRLLRVFKLAKSWKSLNAILTILSKTFGALSNLTGVLVTVIFVFAILGMELFGQIYLEKICEKFACEMPRWNFTDFMHSFMIVFRVLCGEWIESMWNCLHIAGPTCVFYFMATVIVANLVILNLFLALLLNSFSEIGGEGPTSTESVETDKMLIVFQRVKRLFVKKSKIEPMPRSDKYVVKCDDDDQPQQHKLSHIPATISPQTETPIKKDEKVLAGTSRTHETMFYTPDDEVIVADCCHKRFYGIFSCFGGSNKEEEDKEQSRFWQEWSRHRLMASRLIENRYFEGSVLVLILVSSLVMTLEDIWLSTRPFLGDVLFHLDRVLAALYCLETFIKLFAFGFVGYFGNAWCWLDFGILAVSLLNLCGNSCAGASVPIFKTMRTLRALRPLRAMAKLQKMKVVVNALFGALPHILNVLLVCLIFWLIFAIVGVNLFMGRFYRCVDRSTGLKFSHEVVPSREVCLTTADAEWTNARIHFDNVPMAYLALMQVATWKGWMEIMYDAVDAVKVSYQPRREANIYMYLYFVAFIVFGSFFTLNLLVGVIIDQFNMQKSKTGSYLESFMTDDQRKYIAAMRKAATKKPLKALPRPSWKPQAVVFAIITSKKFEMVIMGFIGFNLLVMMCDHHDQSQAWTTALDTLNICFVVIFTAELSMKLFALRLFYFRDGWNIFDFVVVLLSLVGVFLSDIIEKHFVSPTMLRLLRVVKIGRVLRIVRGAKGIRTLLFSLVMASPALFNIGLLLFLVMFIFSVFGMSLFKNVKIRAGFDDVHNFQTFGKTFSQLFQVCTSAGWADTLNAISEEKGCTWPDADTGQEGNCGSKLAGVVFIVLYLLLTFLIVINMYIAVILENYTQANDDVTQGITDDDYDMFYEVWKEFDTEGTQYIALENLSDFLDSLEKPLRVAKPNRFRVIQMEIPVGSRGDDECVFCADILDVITQEFFFRKKDDDKENSVQPSCVERVKVASWFDCPGFERNSSTLWKQREYYCASLIQRTFRLHHQAT